MKRILLILLFLVGNCQARIDDNLVAWWKTNDNAASTTVVDSAGTNTGTFTDVTGDPNTNAHDVAGRVNGALAFSGDDYIACGNDSTLQITGSLSVSAWFKTSSSASQYIVAKDDATNRDWILFKPATDVVQFVIFISNTEKTVASTSNVYADGVWHHYVGVNDGTDLHLYIDGKLNKTDLTDGGTIDNDAANVEIGRQGDGSDYVNGSIDNVMIFNRKLTALEVKHLYNGGVGLEEIGQRSLRGRYSGNIRSRYNIN